jgi:hypothetical protein
MKGQGRRSITNSYSKNRQNYDELKKEGLKPERGKWPHKMKFGSIQNFLTKLVASEYLFVVQKLPRQEGGLLTLLGGCVGQCIWGTPLGMVQQSQNEPRKNPTLSVTL